MNVFSNVCCIGPVPVLGAIEYFFGHVSLRAQVMVTWARKNRARWARQLRTIRHYLLLWNEKWNAFDEVGTIGTIRTGTKGTI